MIRDPRKQQRPPASESRWLFGLTGEEMRTILLIAVLVLCVTAVVMALIGPSDSWDNSHIVNSI